MKGRRAFPGAAIWALLGGMFIGLSAPGAQKYSEVRNLARRQDSTSQLPANLGRGLRRLAAMDTDLLADTPNESARSDAIARKFPRMQRDIQHRVLVDVYLDGTQTMPGAVAQVRKAGGDVVAQVAWYRKGVLTAWVPVRQAAGLAQSYGISAEAMRLLANRSRSSPSSSLAAFAW